MIYLEMKSDAIKYHLEYVSTNSPNNATCLKEKLKKEHEKYIELISRSDKNTTEYKYLKKCRAFYYFLYKNIETIVSANIIDLEEYEKQFIYYFHKFFEDMGEDKYTEIFNNVKTLFENEYKRFSKGYLIEIGKQIKHWNAYEYIKLLRIKVCPYCNAQFTLTIHTTNDKAEGGPSRAELDHFIPKNEYPIFSMSLYNLVPSCKVCNQSLKHSRKTSFSTHFNPFDKEIDNEFYFSRQFKRYKKKKNKINYVDAILGETNNFEITISPKSIFNNLHLTRKEKIISKKVNNNIKLFRLKSIYNQHKD
ncbi:TPA: HNH endonuclease, partial [Bacillus mycoides]|nr:HNH endonuclease [Bacillus mycoides]